MRRYINSFKSEHETFQRKPEMDEFGFNGDTFSNGFGTFYVAK